MHNNDLNRSLNFIACKVPALGKRRAITDCDPDSDRGFLAVPRWPVNDMVPAPRASATAKPTAAARTAADKAAAKAKEALAAASAAKDASAKEASAAAANAATDVAAPGQGDAARKRNSEAANVNYEEAPPAKVLKVEQTVKGDGAHKRSADEANLEHDEEPAAKVHKAGENEKGKAGTCRCGCSS